jgi:transposase-like protein
LDAVIDLDSKLLLGVSLSKCQGINLANLATEFLQQLTENHDLSDTEFLVDGYGCLTALFGLYLSGHLAFVNRNLIKEWFHTVRMRADRFHHSYVGSWDAVVSVWMIVY